MADMVMVPMQEMEELAPVMVVVIRVLMGKLNVLSLHFENIQPLKHTHVLILYSKYIAANRGAVHVAPLVGHIQSVKSTNQQPAPGMHIMKGHIQRG